MIQNRNKIWNKTRGPMLIFPKRNFWVYRTITCCLFCPIAKVEMTHILNFCSIRHCRGSIKKLGNYINSICSNSTLESAYRIRMITRELANVKLGHVTSTNLFCYFMSSIYRHRTSKFSNDYICATKISI